MLDKLIIKILWAFKPFLIWFDTALRIKWTVKQVDFDEYYTFGPLIEKGMVFVADTFGEPSNLINPSKDKHGAIFFGYGLKTHIENLLVTLEYDPAGEFKKDPNHPRLRQINRIKKVFLANGGPLVPKGIKDEIPYVIEAIGEGVTVTSLGKFMTTKDKLKAFKPTFADKEQMGMAANAAVLDLGLPYDYGFGMSDEAKYCFEVVADSYIKVFPNLQLKQGSILGHNFFLATAFTDSPLWDKIIDL